MTKPRLEPDTMGRALAPEQGCTDYCCGVLELGEMPEDVTISGRTYAEKLSAWKEFVKSRKKYYGMIIAFLLPYQHTGEVGRILRDTKFKVDKPFVNPNTTNDLWMYSKVINPKRKPRLKKSTLSR